MSSTTTHARRRVREGDAGAAAYRTAKRNADCRLLVEATDFTHSQMAESVERSLSGLSTALLGPGSQQSFILNTPPFNRSVCLSLGFLPAVVMGVPLLRFDKQKNSHCTKNSVVRCRISTAT